MIDLEGEVSEDECGIKQIGAHRTQNRCLSPQPTLIGREIQVPAGNSSFFGSQIASEKSQIDKNLGFR